MSVAKFDFDGVVADEFPAGDFYAAEFFGSISAVLIAEDIFFAYVLSAWGVGS